MNLCHECNSMNIVTHYCSKCHRITFVNCLISYKKDIKIKLKNFLCKSCYRKRKIK